MPKPYTIISSKLPIIGLTGTFAGGKDTLAKYLCDELGYHHASTSDIVRKFSKEKYGSIERPFLNKTATWLRHTRGAGVLAGLSLKEGKPLIVSGIRSLGETKAIKAAKGVIIFVDAPLEVRYARMQSRHRDKESSVSLEDFKAREQKEWHTGNTEADYNIPGIKKMADILIDNIDTKEAFIEEANHKLAILADNDNFNQANHSAGLRHSKIS